MRKFSPDENKKFWNDFAKKSKDNKFGASGGKHLVEIDEPSAIQLNPENFSSSWFRYFIFSHLLNSDF